MGVPFVGHGGEHESAFIQVRGAELRFDGYEAVACTHCGIDGPVTEALVSGPGAYDFLSRAYPQALKLARVHSPEWLEQSILAASGIQRPHPGLLAVSALRAPREELTLLSHPDAPCGVSLLNSVAGFFSHFQV